LVIAAFRVATLKYSQKDCGVWVQIAAPDRSLEQINVSVATLTCRCGDFAEPDAVLRGY